MMESATVHLGYSDKHPQWHGVMPVFRSLGGSCVVGEVENGVMTASSDGTGRCVRTQNFPKSYLKNDFCALEVMKDTMLTPSELSLWSRATISSKLRIPK